MKEPIPAPPLTSPGSGVAGTQSRGDHDFIGKTEAPFGGAFTALQGIVERNPRSLGSDAAGQLVMGLYSQTHTDLGEARQDALAKQSRIDGLTADVSALRVELAKASTELRFTRENQTLKNFCIFIGTIVAGLGIDQIKSNNSGPGWACLIVGTALVIYGWLSGKKPFQGNKNV